MRTRKYLQRLTTIIIKSTSAQCGWSGLKRSNSAGSDPIVCLSRVSHHLFVSVLIRDVKFNLSVSLLVFFLSGVSSIMATSQWTHTHTHTHTLQSTQVQAAHLLVSSSLFSIKVIYHFQPVCFSFCSTNIFLKSCFQRVLSELFCFLPQIIIGLPCFFFPGAFRVCRTLII